MKNRCDAFRALIPLYADGKLDAKNSAKFKKHITKCPVCSTLLDAQIESMKGSGRLYILGQSMDNAIKTAKRRKALVTCAITAACLIIALVLTAVCLRLAGFVRITSVATDELSLEDVQNEYPDMLISETDMLIVQNASKAVDEFFASDPDAHFSRFRFSMSSDEVKDINFAGGSVGSSLYEDYIMVSYRTAFHYYLLSWNLGEEPQFDTISKTRYSRFRIFDLIREIRLFNSGNNYFSKYTETLDLWGTLTRQEL